MVKIPFFDLGAQYQSLKAEIEPGVLQVLESCSYINGKNGKELEERIAKYLGAKHAVGCGNGTDALVLALRACQVGPGDEVITTPFTFFATAEAIASVGAVPVFVDVRKDDYMIDPSLIEAAITEKTKAILPVHIFGGASDMDAIMGIAKEHGLYVIEDAAQAMGAGYRGRKLGGIGHVGCFSFYPTKNLGGCGDGGMAVTSDDELADRLRALREHGSGEPGKRIWERSGKGGKKEEAVDKYRNYMIGYNSRLDELQACVLLVKFAHLEEFNSRRRQIAALYSQCLTDLVQLPKYGEDTEPCWHQFVILSEDKAGLCDYLLRNGIGCNTFYPVPLHRQEAFQEAPCRIHGGNLPVVDGISAQSVCLPIFPELTDAQVRQVAETVNRFCEEKGK